MLLRTFCEGLMGTGGPKNLYRILLLHQYRRPFSDSTTLKKKGKMTKHTQLGTML